MLCRVPSLTVDQVGTTGINFLSFSLPPHTHTLSQVSLPLLLLVSPVWLLNAHILFVVAQFCSITCFSLLRPLIRAILESDKCSVSADLAKFIIEYCKRVLQQASTIPVRYLMLPLPSFFLEKNS